MSTSPGPPESVDQPDDHDVIETAKEAFARGYTPVRLRERNKKPALKGWPNTRYSSESEVEDAFAPGRDGAP